MIILNHYQELLTTVIVSLITIGLIFSNHVIYFVFLTLNILVLLVMSLIVDTVTRLLFPNL